MKCNLCDREHYKTIFGIPYCKKDFIITKNILVSSMKNGLPRKIDIENIIKYIELKEDRISIPDLMKEFDISFNTAREYMLELAQIEYVMEDHGKWIVTSG